MTEHDTTMPVQRLDLQAKLLCSVLKFSTRRLDRLVVGIVYQSSKKQLAQEFAAELEKLEYNGGPVSWKLFSVGELDDLDPEINVLYVAPGSEAFLDRIFDISSKRKMFSCTGIPSYVEQGKVSLGFDSYHGNPRILLNLPLARSAGFDFKNPKFLNLQKPEN